MKCKNCGTNLDSLLDLPNGERATCPNCGSTERVFEVSIQEKITLASHMALLGKRGGKSISFRESLRNQRASSADQNDDGNFSHSMVGSSPQGEEDTSGVCQLLVKVLNMNGGNWENLSTGQGLVDYEATDRNNGQKLFIQVTRSISKPDFWKTISQMKGFDEKGITKGQLVDLLRDAIAHKANDKNIPFISRKSLVLALDATRLPVFGFDDVIEEFHQKYFYWIRELGFQAIWLVGPQSELVRQLN